MALTYKGVTYQGPTAPSEFPVYALHETINCFNCSSHIVGGIPTGYSEGRGAYKAYCAKCRMFTFYDWL